MNTAKRMSLLVLCLCVAPLPATAEAPPHSHDQPDIAELFAQAGPSVVLVDAGAEPRQELRYDFSGFTPQTMQMDMNMSMSMEGPATGTQQQTLPTMRMIMSIPTVEVTPEGNLRMAFSLDRYEVLPTEGVAPEMMQALQASLASVGTMSGWNIIDNRGSFVDGDITVSAGSSAAQMMTSIEDSMEQMVAPFPAEAVGLGARWQTSTEVTVNGLTLAQTAGFTLVSRSGDTVVLDVTIEQNAPPQDIADPSMPPGAVAHLDEMHTTGSGRMTLSLTNVVPNSTLSMATAMRMSVIQGGTTSPAMAMTTSIDMVIGPLP